MDEIPKKKRIRASDLLKQSRRFGESKYDFSKINELKGGTGRDASKKGRPAGISGVSRATSDVDAMCSDTPSEMNTSLITNSIDDDDMPNMEPVPSEEPSTHQITLSPEQVYSNLLKENNGMICMDDIYQKFALQDFDSQRSALKAMQFVFVSRRCMIFQEEPYWIYTCTCDPVTAELVDCCGERMDVSYNGFMERIPGCIHTNTTSDIMEQFDAQNLIEPVLAENEDEGDDVSDPDRSTDLEDLLKLRDGMYIVKCDKGAGVVQQTETGIKCLTCNCSVNRCCHLHKFYGVFGEQEIPTMEKTTYHQKCYSTIKIPYYSTPAMQQTYKTPISERFPGDNIINFRPEIENCDACGEVLQESDRKKSHLFVKNQILETYVSSKKCPDCSKEFYFDGFSHCVLNMGRIIYCHEILRRFMYYFLSGKSTIFTEYQVLRKTFVDAGFKNFEDKMTYQDFKSAWYAFLELLDIDYDNGFHCPDCGPDPDTVVMDATSVAFRKELICWESLFSSESRNSKKPCDAVDRDRVRERTLFSKAVRSCLIDFSKATKGTSKETFEKILKIIEIENGNVEIVNLLNVVFKASTIKGDRYFCSGTWKEFIKALASSNPFCSFLPPSEDFFTFLDKALSEPNRVLQDDSVLKRIQTTVPVIFKLLSNLKDSFPFKEFKACLPYFQQKVFDPFIGDRCPSEDPEEDDDGLSFFPSLPTIRRRGLFAADKKRSKNKDFVCNKLAQGHPSLLPGVFTLFCPHGICYGFQVMKFHESPDVPFSLLRSRFRTAPKLVIYDNACSLQTYCLNRDPCFFLDTVFRVDGLHFKNHKACGPSFELKSYPQYAELNSQVVEQSNSRLQRVKGSLSYMTQINFMRHCKFYLWGQNDEILSKMKI